MVRLRAWSRRPSRLSASGPLRQVFLAIGAVKFLHVLGVGVHNQQMSGHGTFLSDWMLSNESHIGSAAALMGYGILTVSDQSLGCCGPRLPEARAAVRQ